ncbi:MAG: DUF4197 domain-containing protein [Campylobacter sp.]
MRKSLILIAFLAGVCLQANWQDNLKQGAQMLKENRSDYKNLLTNALNLAVSELSDGGFLNNEIAKISLPTSLQAATNLAKSIGGEKWAKEITTSINEAATKAVGGAAGVLVDVVKNMSDTDAKNLFSGGNDSITNFLQKNSSEQLGSVFKPIIEDMMSKNSFATAYNGLNSLILKSDMAKQAKAVASNFGIDFGANDEDLNSYITRKTLDGLFEVMREKEKSLRGVSTSEGVNVLKNILK